MPLLPILRYPDKRLHIHAKPVDSVDDSIRQLIDDMAETMYQAPGIGLAAIQVNVPKRVVVIDVSETHSSLIALVNPEIFEQSGEQTGDEGCLSVPDIYESVTRAERIKVRALDRDGKPFELETDGLLAVCIQHEIDHLNGKVFVEYLSKLKLNRIKTRLAKRARDTA